MPCKHEGHTRQPQNTCSPVKVLAWLIRRFFTNNKHQLSLDTVQSKSTSVKDEFAKFIVFAVPVPPQARARGGYNLNGL